MTTPDATPSPTPRRCPLCDGASAGPAFPYATRYLGQRYGYLGCGTCGTRFIDPLPDAAAFAAMYAPGDYHDVFYDGDGQGEYARTAAKLAAHLPVGARLLDYGCGAGHFVMAARAAGLDAAGAEHSAEAAANAAQRTGATMFDLGTEAWRAGEPWDCIHLGDVIEHLPDPRASLRDVLGAIRPGGWLSVEGPLEANASLVHGAIRLTGWAKRLAGRSEGSFAPYHLLFTDAVAQRALFDRLGEPLRCEYWELSETGWPYRGNGALRNAIALAAIRASRVPVLGSGLGDRFRALFRRES